MIHRVSRPSRPEFRPGAVGVRAVLFALVVIFGVTNCTPVAMPSLEPGPARPSVPAIEEGSRLPGAMAAEAARSLQGARRNLAQGAFEGARDAARDVIVHYPSAEGSAEALGILAVAALELGDPAESAEASERFLALLAPTHSAFPGAVVLNSRALAELGDTEASIGKLLTLPAGTPPAEREEGSNLLRALLPQVEASALEGLAEDARSPSPFLGILATELSVSLLLDRDKERADRWALAALSEELDPRDEALCRAVLEGDLEAILGEAVVLGAILPRSGVSPGLLEYGELVLEGIQVAVEEYQALLRRSIRLEVFDHEGENERGREAARTLEELGAIGAVGPLTMEFLSAVAFARNQGLPLVSPFSSLPPDEAPGVYSLSGPNPGGSEVVARYSRDLGLERVVVLRPGTEEARVDADAFRSVFQALGGMVPREVVYDSGATFFQRELKEVGSLLPDGLFLPVMPRDIQLLAPQFTYYGLDTLGIQLLGTSGWTEDDIVLEVDSRHTDGVIASTTRISQDETEAYRRFRIRYEDLFQKSLRTSVPAYGYDSAVLLLEALRSNPRNSSDVLRTLDSVNDFPGATGHFNSAGGRLLRVPQLVRIQDHELIYISPHIH